MPMSPIILSTTPRITIVTPSFNQARFLEACIDSVLSQGYPNLEYILMDGGSTDGSIEIIKKHSKFLNFWQSCPDGGHYAAVDAGFKRSTGEIMGWLNSDDMLCSKSLFVLSDVFGKMPEVDFLTGKRIGFDESGTLVLHHPSLARWCRSDLLSKESFEREDFLCVVQEATYWRRRLWERSGSCIDSSLKLAADFELWARFSRTAKLYTVDAKIGGFRAWGTEQRSNKFRDDYRREAFSVIERETKLGLDLGEEHLVPPSLIRLPLGVEIKQPPKKRRNLDFTPRQPNLEYPKISVVTVCKNQGTYLDQCIESVLSQSWPNLQYIIVDCGSVDESAETIKTVQSCVEFHRLPAHTSWYQGLEFGLKRATGDIMAWLHPEDKYHPGTFNQVAVTFQRHPDLSWVTGRPFAWDEAGELKWISCLPPVHARRCWLYGNFNEPYINQEGMFWRNELWKKAGGSLDTKWKYAADFELWLRFSRYAELRTVNLLWGGARDPNEDRYESFPVKYAFEVRKIAEEEKHEVAITPFDNALPPMPILQL